MPDDLLDMALIDAELQSNEPEKTRRQAWLDESCRHPAKFWRALKRTNDSFFNIPGKSIPYKAYDFYHDIITRNQESRNPALCWYDPVLGWKNLSYSDLGALASQKAEAWRRSGAAPGRKVCIVLHLGPEFLVALIAAFKVGLSISVLPPIGKQFLNRRIEALMPDYIETDRLFLPMIAAWEEIVLAPVGVSITSTSDSEKSHAYASGSVLGHLFDPSSHMPHLPVELACDDIYLNPLRDGTIVLGLRPGQSLAAPGTHFLETQPALIIAVLLSGATFFHIEPQAIRKNPELLCDHPITCMGLDKQLRDLLLQHPVALSEKWSCIFRNPAESNDLDLWQQLIKKLDVGDAWCMNLKWDTAVGGCSLFSTKIKGKMHLHVLPSAGVPWVLTDISGNGIPLDDNFGIFSVETTGSPDGELCLTTNILVTDRQEWLYTGSSAKGRKGRHYPIEEVLDAVRGIQHCSLCSISELPEFQNPGHHTYRLLIFIGWRSKIAAEEIIGHIRETLLVEMGAEFIPDKIRIFSLYPRLNEDKLMDYSWCHSQYVSGSLYNKLKDELYRAITRLRRHVASTGIGL